MNNLRSKFVVGSLIALLCASNISLMSYGEDARALAELTPRAYRFVGRGAWVEAADALLADQTKQKTEEDGWLALSYYISNQCEPLSHLCAEVTKADAYHKDIVTALDLACQKKDADALPLLAHVVSLNKEDLLANFAYAIVLAANCNYEQAHALFTDCAQIAPDFAPAYFFSGMIEEHWLGQPAKAVVDYNKTLDISPGYITCRDRLVDLYLNKNDFDSACDVADKGIKSQPNDSASYFRLAQIYIQQWRLKEALILLDKAIALDPANAKLHRSKASILRWQGNFDQAIREQTEAVELSKDKAFELIELAGINVLAGYPDRACDNLNDALAGAPANQSAHEKLVVLLKKQKRFDDLVKEYQRVCVLNDKDESSRLGLAQAYEAVGAADQAAKAYRLAANLNGKDPFPHQRLGALYLRSKEYEKAAKEYTMALNINPSSADDLIALGYCYAANDQYVQAETAFVTALALKQLTQDSGPELTRSRIDLLRSLATLFLAEGRYTEAVQQFETLMLQTKANKMERPADQIALLKAIALRDRSHAAAKALTDAFNSLPAADKEGQANAVVKILLSINQTDLANAVITQYVKDDTTNAAWLAAQAKALSLAGDLTKAKELALAAIKQADRDQESLCDANVELGAICLKLDDAGGATKAFSQACNANPKSYIAYEGLGRAALKTKQAQLAADAASHALEIDPYFAKAYVLLGDSYMVQGKTQAAIEAYKKALDIYPAYLATHERLLVAYQKSHLADDEKAEQKAIEAIKGQQASH